MKTSISSSSPDLIVTHVLAQLLERLDQSTVPVGAAQYRAVAQHLASELHDIKPDGRLNALLETHPAMAELYENLNYQYAGLCRSSLDSSLAAERQAKQAIERAMRQPKEGISSGKI